MAKKIPALCQQASLNGLLCDNATQGVAAYEGDEGETLYVGLCSRHGRDVLKVVQGAWLSIVDAEARMNGETDAPAQAREETTFLYTTAPREYDGFGVQTVCLVGHYGTDKLYRLVSVPVQHMQWYSARCGSGLHNVHTEEEWAELTQEAFFQKKFVAINDNPEHTEDTPMQTTVETPVTAPVTPMYTITPSAPISLADLAAHVNGHKVDPTPTAPAVKVPAVPKTAAPSSDTAQLGRIKSAAELEEEALAEQIKTLMAQRDALKRERIAREKAEAEAARQAKRLAQAPLYTFGQASELRTSLMLHGGSRVLSAVETLIEAGVLTVRHGALVVKKTREQTETSDKGASSERTAPAPTARTASTGKGHSEDIKAQVFALKAQGKGDKAIADALGLSASTVYSMCKRAAA
jgi:Homeodomain-like domain